MQGEDNVLKLIMSQDLRSCQERRGQSNLIIINRQDVPEILSELDSLNFIHDGNKAGCTFEQTGKFL